MHIALVAPFGLRAKGTTRARALPLGQALAQHGHTVTLFVPPYDSPADAGRRWHTAGVDVTNIELPRGASDSPIWHLKLGWQLYRAVADARPDVVHIFKPKGPSGIVGALIWVLRRAGRWRPVLVVDADDWEGWGGWNDDPRVGYTRTQKYFFAWQERFGLSHADAWTVTSRCLAERAVAYGAARARVHTLHNGVMSERLVAPRLHDPGAAPLAVLYTRFAGVRPADVLEIWRQVRMARPAARLIVIGRGQGGEEAQLADSDGIELLGWQEPDAVQQWLARATVALAPWADTPANQARHSAKVLELMAAGTPVVAYAVGELPVTVSDGGVLIPPDAPGHFAAAVIDLLTNAQLATTLGQRARTRAATIFNWPAQAEVALQAYENGYVPR